MFQIRRLFNRLFPNRYPFPFPLNYPRVVISKASLYAFPSLNKYPIDAEHIQAAISYANAGARPFDADGNKVSDDEWERGLAQIAAAASAHYNEVYTVHNGKVVQDKSEVRKAEFGYFDDEDVPVVITPPAPPAEKNREIIFKADLRYGIMKSVVYTANEPDDEGHFCTNDTLRRAAYKWMEKYAAVDDTHSKRLIPGRIVENYVTDEPHAQWIMAFKPHDPSILERPWSGWSMWGHANLVRRDSIPESVN